MLATSADAAAAASAVVAVAVAAGALDEQPGTAEALPAGTTPAGIEDVLITSGRWFHVLRRVEVPAAEPVLVYLRLRRGHANPALARRELASVGFRDALLAAVGASATVDTPAAAAVPIPVPRPAPHPLAAAPTRPAAAARPLGLPARGPGVAAPVRRPASHPPPAARPAIGLPSTSTGHPAGPGTPRHTDGTTLPRRVRGAQLAGPSNAAEPMSAAPGQTAGVLRQGWLSDPVSLRRLLAGLRRMG
ncbi:MAG: hypothetical protein ACT4RN_04510 [Pseudonocardia sp.]